MQFKYVVNNIIIFKKTIYLFIWLHQVFFAACRLSLVAASGLLVAVASLVERGL